MPAAIPLTVIIKALRARGISRMTPLAAQELHLDEIDWIDVRIADVDGPADDRRRLEQLGATGHVEHAADGAGEPGAKVRTERLQIIGHQAAIVLRGDARIRLREHHFDELHR